MPGHGRRQVRAAGLASLISLLSLFLVIIPCDLLAQVIDWRMPPTWLQDAEPTDLFFVDREQGWIVGDRGLVLRTIDGGKNWQNVKLLSDQLDPEAPAVTCRLETVFFASPNHGWIAGGFSNPRSTTSIGVLFATTDGGNSWKRIQGIALPKINQLMFTSPVEGIAIGDGNAMKPSGIFHTRDGGRSWSTNTDGPLRSWQAASHANGIITLVDADGRMAQQTADRLTDAPIDLSAAGALGEKIPEFPANLTTTETRIRQIRMIDERFGFAVGDQANFLQTRNGGLSWHSAAETPNLPTTFVDFRALEIVGERMWIVGNPETRMFIRSSPDSAWQSIETPISAPITNIRFVDELFGWAISLSGDVIHSKDGGQSWSIQRRGTRGVALMQIAGNNDEFVPELFSRYCGDEGYIGAALSLNLVDPATAWEPNTPSRSEFQKEPSIDLVRQSLSRVGCSFVDNREFAPYSFGNGLSQTVQPGGRAKEFLVRQIRSLRPRVIAIPSGRVMNDAYSVRSYVLDAVKSAADSQQYPRQISEFGLEPWHVGKVIVMDRGDVATLKISPGHYMMGLAALVGDHSMTSRMLLNQPPIEGRPISLTTIFTSPFAAGPATTLFGSIENTDAEVPVRKGQQRTAGNMAQMRQLASKRKTLERLLDGSPNMSPNGIWGSNLAQLTIQLDDAAAGVWLFELASICDAAGETELALQTHLYLTSQFRNHPLAVASFRWLYNHYSSTEQAHISIRQAQLNEASAIKTVIPDGGVQSRPVKRMVNGVEVISWEVDDPRKAEDSAVDLVGWTTEQRNSVLRRRYQQARAIAQSLAMIDPTALDTGRYQLARIGLNQRLDPLISIGDQLKRIAGGDDALADVALQELGILNRRANNDPVKYEVACASAKTRPWLDGNLNDKMWVEAIENRSIIPLAGTSGRTSDDQLIIAADDEFLFVAIRCRQQRDIAYEPDSTVRPRDSQLTEGDRVEIAIDIDRDYETFYLFSIDSSGKVADSFGNNLAWNPAWYVATDFKDGYWIAEIAIPLTEISKQGDFWSIAVNRHIRNQLVSNGWLPSEIEAAKATSPQPSFHRAAIERQSNLHAMPLQAFRLVRMPWSSSDGSKTRDLPQGE